MPGDGVSLTTTLSQLGNVAKTQARAQQTTPQVTPFSEQKDEQDELTIQRIKETTEAEKNRVAEESEEKDKRKRRRLKRHRRHPADNSPVENDATAEENEDQKTEEMGSLIDLRV